MTFTTSTASPGTSGHKPQETKSVGQSGTAVGQKTWHRLCFRCCKCNIVISDEFFFKDNLQHCLRCYKKYCDVTCLTCNQLIVGTMITAGNKRYHPHCAFCSVCGGQFKQGVEMLIEGQSSQ